MNNILKTKLTNVLKAEAISILHSDKEMSERFSIMNDISNLLKIIDNYDELEPVLKKFFEEKHQKDKWNNQER